MKAVGLLHAGSLASCCAGPSCLGSSWSRVAIFGGASRPVHHLTFVARVTPRAPGVRAFYTLVSSRGLVLRYAGLRGPISAWVGASLYRCLGSSWAIAACWAICVIGPMGMESCSTGPAGVLGKERAWGCWSRSSRPSSPRASIFVCCSGVVVGWSRYR